MVWKFNDGGRAKAGYITHARDCVCRSIAIVENAPYKAIYQALNLMIKCGVGIPEHSLCQTSAREGVFTETWTVLAAALQYRKIYEPSASVLLRNYVFPEGRFLVHTPRHLTAIVNGEIQDTWDCSGQKILSIWQKIV